MTSLFTLALLGAPVFDLRLHATSKPIVLNAIEERSEGGKSNSLGTRLEIVVGSDLAASLTTGPFNSGGRTFGRPKTSHPRLSLQGTVIGDRVGRPPFLLATPLPGHAIKTGDAWNGVIVGPTPMPAGVKATFRVLGPATVAGVPCMRIGVKIDTELSGAHITGSGTSIVRLGDGIVQSGSLNVLLVYHRPNQATGKMEENARVNVKATISR